MISKKSKKQYPIYLMVDASHDSVEPAGDSVSERGATGGAAVVAESRASSSHQGVSAVVCPGECSAVCGAHRVATCGVGDGVVRRCAGVVVSRLVADHDPRSSAAAGRWEVCAPVATSGRVAGGRARVVISVLAAGYYASTSVSRSAAAHSRRQVCGPGAVAAHVDRCGVVARLVVLAPGGGASSTVESPAHVAGGVGGAAPGVGTGEPISVVGSDRRVLDATSNGRPAGSGTCVVVASLVACHNAASSAAVSRR